MMHAQLRILALRLHSFTLVQYGLPLAYAFLRHLETLLAFLYTILCLKDLIPGQRHRRNAAVQLAFYLVQGIQQCLVPHGFYHPAVQAGRVVLQARNLSAGRADGGSSTR